MGLSDEGLANEDVIEAIEGGRLRHGPVAHAHSEERAAEQGFGDALNARDTLRPESTRPDAVGREGGQCPS